MANKQKAQDWSNYVIRKIRQYQRNNIFFTKIDDLKELQKRNKASIGEMKNEIIENKYLIFAEKQKIEHQGSFEDRFRCYFVFNNNKARCYVFKFNKKLKVITAFILGKTTLRKYRKKFK